MYKIKMVAAVAFLSGCQPFSQIRSSNGSRNKTDNRVVTADINDAADRQDIDFLRTVCNGGRPTRFADGKEYACDRLKRLESRQQALGADCVNVRATFDTSDTHDADYVTAMAKKIAGCGHWEHVFQAILLKGNNKAGVQMLMALDNDGFPVEQEWAKYLDTHVGPNFFPVEHLELLWGVSEHPMDRIGDWLIAKGRTQYCPEVAKAAKSARDSARAGAMRYLTTAVCKEGLAILVSVLASDNEEHRLLACKALGAVGGKDELEKVLIVAQTDPASEVQDRVKTYPLREACLAAAGKIQLRN
jgi:hypothetical protein